MRPIDYRNATFAELQQHIAGDRERVLAAWQAHGPCTTEDLAQRSGLSILTLRPRTTELVQLGFVVLLDWRGGLPSVARRAKGGCYRAATADEVFDHFHTQQSLANGQTVQTELAINLPTRSRYF